MVPIILIIAGILLVVLNFNAVRKEKKSFQDKLNVKRNEMGNCELEIGKIRKEFAETILELQKEIEDLKKQGNQDFHEVILSEEAFEGSEEKLVEEEIKDNNEEESEKSENLDEAVEEDANNIKIDEIRGLLKDNISVSDISEKTGIGKGEVLLIKELYTK
ncbi:hypothetical protein [Clostridium coskatii]|uniref:Uncharacterized protein n=1 Tax=Clostridium coskatii TaxID=1705578 RepID=A0A170NIG3_9CLOT|nr:hypothetical protein [Clostridium coskatii]OAA89278.1 hypothetical protein WX73_02532 [Clostridium coskatii]OBR97386.1 hypothetical protein CLCOS_04440 [Clostridium coskatii]